MTGRGLLAGIILSLLMLAYMCISGVGAMAAEEPQFILEMDSLDIDVDSDTLMTLSMINAKGAKVKEYVGMDWVYTMPEGTSRTTEIINGKKSYVETESSWVAPYYSGKFKIWAVIEYEGKTYMTNKVELTVRENGTVGNEQSKNTYLNTKLLNNEIYLGQKTVLAYEMYSIYQIDSSFFLKDLQINDILHNEVPEDKLKKEKTIQDGIEYTRTEVEISYLTPIKPGVFSIPARNFYAYISEDEHLSDDKSTAKLLSEPKELIVKPLPAENQPSDFSWIIGKLKVDSRYSKSDIDGDNSVILTVTASGDCNIDSLKEIFKEDPPGFTAYENETKYMESFENNKYNAEKEFKITLIPKEKGELTIDPVYISYFDPGSGSYERAEIPGVTVTADDDDVIIQKGNIQAGGGQAGGEQKAGDQTTVEQTAGEQTGGDQAENKAVETIRIEQVSYEPQNEGFWILRINKTAALIIITLLLILGAAAFFLLKRPIKHDDKLDDIYAQLLKTNDINEIYNHFNSMISHCFGLSLKASSRSEIADGIPDKRFVKPILGVLEYIESGKYVPGRSTNKLVDMIKGIYKMLKQRKTI